MAIQLVKESAYQAAVRADVFKCAESKVCPIENWNSCVSASSGVRTGNARLALKGPSGLYQVTPTPTELAIWLPAGLLPPTVRKPESMRRVNNALMGERVFTDNAPHHKMLIIIINSLSAKS